MLLPPSLTVIGEYVWETRTEMTLIDEDANLQQTYFPCILRTTSSFYQNILQLHGIMGQLIVHNNSFSKMFLSYMVFFFMYTKTTYLVLLRLLAPKYTLSKNTVILVAAVRS